MTDIRLENIWKFYGDFQALKNIELSIRSGELFVILGPSGAGKTTLLKIITGLLVPDRGKVYFDDIDVTSLEPFDRKIGIVFQTPALFPHMEVWENIAFPLESRGISFKEIVDRVKDMIELMELEGLEHRLPHELSGGQQQRVAIARALILEPKVLLLDEPFANLDAVLRDNLRVLLKKVQKKLKITTVFITHDQEEAFMLADRIGILMHGELIQVGRPNDIYNAPKNEEVAQFLGINIIDGQILGVHGKILIWPNSIKVNGDLKARVKAIYNLKEFKRIAFLIGDETIEMITTEELNLSEGQEVRIKIEKMKILYKDHIKNSDQHIY